MNVRASLILITLLSSLSLAGCATPVKKIEISAAPIDKPPLTLPKTSKLKMRDVKWKIVNKDNIDSVLADMDKKGENLVLFTLTDKGYEALALNTADLRKMVMEQKAIIAAYEQYYQESQSALDAANNQIDSAKSQVDSANSSTDKNCSVPFFCKE